MKERVINKVDKNNKRSWGYFFGMTGLNLVIIIVLTVLILSGLSVWMGIYTRHNEHIELPSLKGIDVNQAGRFLEEKNLRYMVIDSVYSDQMPGCVIEQIPSAGTPVKKDRIVYLTIQAYGQRMVKMQEVRQGGSRQALATLRSLGFQVDSVRKVAYDMDDLVLSVASKGEEMIPGKEYPYGTKVVVSVGSTHVAIEPENEEPEEAWTE